MKLRSIISVGAMALAAVAFADGEYTDGKVVGWLRVDSDKAVTVIGVPWVAVSDTAVNVAVADLVKTDTLDAGDKLYVYDNGTWKLYILSAEKKWVGATTVSDSGPAAGVQAGDDSAVIARGQALYLERQTPATPFYLYGAVGSDITTTTLTGATKYLVASPKAAAFVPQASAISGATAKSRKTVGDQIVVPLEGGATRVYTLVSGEGGYKWGYVNEAGVRVQEGEDGYLPVQLGTGFWYVTASAENSVTITW